VNLATVMENPRKILIFLNSGKQMSFLFGTVKERMTFESSLNKLLYKEKD